LTSISATTIGGTINSSSPWGSSPFRTMSCRMSRRYFP
jgi:hypothetical protein